MRAFIKFNKGMMRMSTPVRLWLMLLVIANLIVPLLFFGHLEARVVVVTMLASMMIMTALTALAGFTRILGFGHILWIPMLFWLWSRFDQVPTDDVFGIWIRALVVLNAISLLLDTVDVVRYLRGDREEVVDGLDGVSAMHHRKPGHP